VPDLAPFFQTDYFAARKAALELRIALQHRTEGVAVGKLLTEWRKRAAAANAAAADDGSGPRPVPGADALTF